jgi:hypothetical protein
LATVFGALVSASKNSVPGGRVRRLTGMYYPRGQIFFGMRLPLLLQKRKTRAAVQKMLSWQPERIILSHGRWFDSSASETLQRTFGWAL